MQQFPSSLALVFFIFSGISANFLRDVPDLQQNGNSDQLKIQKNDNFPKYPNCGNVKKSKNASRIWGGTEVEKHEFPWMVKLSNGCSGTLINTRWVLSAAHCFKVGNPSNAEVYLGAHECVVAESETETKSDQITCDYTVKVESENVILHEQYDGLSKTNDNDIALLKLKEPVIFNDKVQPICLPDNNQAIDRNIVGKVAVVSGWGMTEWGEYSDYLLKTNVAIWNADKCETFWKLQGEAVNRKYHICAGGVEGVDTCQGDSGGPLFLRLPSSEDDKNKPYYEVGITSWGYGCGEGFPGIYTNLLTYISWIHDKILENE